MKRAVLLILAFLPACAHPRVAPVPAPSVGAVKAGLGQAQSQIAQAAAATDQIARHLAAARTRAQQIDGKAAVLLDHWQ